MTKTLHLNFLIPFLTIYGFNYLYYLIISKDHLNNKAIKFQLRRFLPASILAALPFYLTGTSLFSINYLVFLLPSLLTSITFPTLYHLTNRHTNSNYDYHYDFVFSISIIAWLSSLLFLLTSASISPIVLSMTITLLSFALCLIPIFEIAYYLSYKECIGTNGLLALLQTNYNEALAFLLERKFQVITLVLTSMALFFLLFKTTFLFFTNNLPNNSNALYHYSNLSLNNLLLLAIIFISSSIYIWNKPPKGIFSKTSVVKLLLAIKDYFKQTALYTKNHKNLLKDLNDFEIPPIKNEPQTIILVIGESASRDYINAFSNCKRQTSPWLSKNKNNNNFILFPNSYSSWHQTVQSLEKSLTEDNQYNDKNFNNSYSIIDVAKAAGYKTTWFSNQGQIGIYDTAISLIADTADRATWTSQRLGDFVYDKELLTLLKEVNPKENNLVVLHLKGSHDPYIFRYPEKETIWGTPKKVNKLDNYDNSIAYTDKLLQNIQEYATNYLNLQFMVYFSDHGAIPDKFRSPSFKGFGMVRIPMFIYLTNNYIKQYPMITQNLKNNQNKYFTNDLIYDLFCGLLDVKSKHYKPEESLASDKYKYNAKTLKTNLGKTAISDDKLDAKNTPI